MTKNSYEKEKQNIQRLAMSGYHPEDYVPKTLTNKTVEEDGYLDGDTLALFIWRECGDASDIADAVHMMGKAITELERVKAALEVKLC